MPQKFKGYIRIWNNQKRGWEYEHRIVMEVLLKRRLKSSETVHHINGNKSDNRVENLIILTRQEHEKKHQNGKKNRKYYLCTVDECKNLHHAKGLCNMHYTRELRNAG